MEKLEQKTVQTRTAKGEGLNCLEHEEMARKDAIQELQKILVKRRDALTKALAGDQSMLVELQSETTGDVVDFASDTAQDEINSQLAEVESRELAHIRYALEKMNEGCYGKCEGCNCNIPLARLQALPYATLCIQCQREAEKTGETPGAGADWTRLVDTSSMDNDIKLSDIELDVP